MAYFCVNIFTMTRKFSFRAWDGKVMHYNIVPWRCDFVIDTTRHKCLESTGSGFLGSGGPTAEMQAPAIRFKELMYGSGVNASGGEMYEGDIRSYTVSSGNLDGVIRVDKKGRNVYHAVIFFENGAFVGKVKNGDGTYSYSFPITVLENKFIEGNIYEGCTV